MAHQDSRRLILPFRSRVFPTSSGRVERRACSIHFSLHGDVAMTLRLFALAVLVLLAGFAFSTPAEAAQPDLFANYYAYPHAGGVPAQMYLSPYPTPPIAGRTYITYQPLMPHEFLY